jgi:lysophospholipase L1-like esterase
MKRRKIFISFGIVLLALVLASVPVILTRKKSIPPPEQKKQNMIALGDSIAAGFGLNTPSDISQCGRTDESYPKLVAQKLGFDLLSFACSGATVPEGILGEQKVDKGAVSAQLDQIPTSTPALITLTIGANDVGWTTYLTKCATTACGTNQDTIDLSSKITSYASGLTSALDKLRTKYSETPIYITGYYHLYPRVNSECIQPTIFEDNELTWLNDATDRLNTAIKAVAITHLKTTYLEPDFSKHLLCTTAPWIEDITDTAPYHPTEEGQKAYAEMVYAAYK